MWKVESGQGRDLIVRKTDGATIAIMGSNASHADAHRICACVGACEGIDTAYLQSPDNLATYARNMTLQRDAAFKDLAEIRKMLGANDEELIQDAIKRLMNGVAA